MSPRRLTLITLAAVLALAGTAAAARPAPRPSLIGVGNIPGGHLPTGNPVPWLHFYRASIYRVIVQERYFGTEAASIARARAAGAKLELVIQYRNEWSLARDRAWFTRVLKRYRNAPYIAIGNEQELPLQGGRGQTGAQYAKTWRAVKPIVRRYAPRAKLIGGEGTGSLKSQRFLEAALRAGLPGVQIIAAHPYCRPPRSFIAIGRRAHLPVWLDEGLAGRYAWPNPGCTFTLDQARGAQMAAVWMTRI